MYGTCNHTLISEVGFDLALLALTIPNDPMDMGTTGRTMILMSVFEEFVINLSSFLPTDNTISVIIPVLPDDFGNLFETLSLELFQFKGIHFTSPDDDG